MSEPNNSCSVFTDVRPAFEVKIQLKLLVRQTVYIDVYSISLPLVSTCVLIRSKLQQKEDA